MDSDIKVDPFDPHKINLSDHIKGEIKLLLQKKIETGGANLSVTQKKLLLVGKALLKKPKIMMLDANVNFSVVTSRD